MYEEKIRKAKLLLTIREYLFFGIMSQRFKWKIIKTDKPAWGWVYLKAGFKESIDGIIYLNEKVLNKSHKHIAYIVCHELLHILNRHGSRKGKNVDEDYYSVACDHTIEIFLRDHLSSLPPPNDTYWIHNDAEKALGPTASVEKVYKYLKNNTQKYLLPTGQTSIDGIPVQRDEIQFDKEFENETSIDDYLEYIQIISNSVLESCKCRGYISGKSYEVLKKFIKIKIPWEDILDDAIKTFSNTPSNHTSWRKLNKYFVPLNINLPSRSDYNISTNTLIITLDSSGSISKKELKKFSYIIYKNFNHFTKIVLFVHDIYVHTGEEFTESQKFVEFLETVGIKGRGGTSHELVFKKIEKMYEDNLDEISLIISLTDNYSDIENIINSFNFWKNIPYIILTNGKILERLPKEIKQIKIDD